MKVKTINENEKYSQLSRQALRLLNGFLKKKPITYQENPIKIWFTLNPARKSKSHSFQWENRKVQISKFTMYIHTCKSGPGTPSSSSSGTASPLRSSSEDLFHSGVGGQTTISGFFSW